MFGSKGCILHRNLHLSSPSLVLSKVWKMDSDVPKTKARASPVYLHSIRKVLRRRLGFDLIKPAAPLERKFKGFEGQIWKRQFRFSPCCLCICKPSSSSPCCFFLLFPKKIIAAPRENEILRECQDEKKKCWINQKIFRGNLRIFSSSLLPFKVPWGRRDMRVRISQLQ